MKATNGFLVMLLILAFCLGKWFGIFIDGYYKNQIIDIKEQYIQYQDSLITKYRVENANLRITRIEFDKAVKMMEGYEEEFK